MRIEDQFDENEESWTRFRAAIPVFQASIEIIREAARNLERNRVNPIVVLAGERPQGLIALLDAMANRQEALIDALLLGGEIP